MNLNSSTSSFDHELFALWESVKRETIESLGNEGAYHITIFHANTWIDINTWIFSKYSKNEKLNILFTEYQRLFKEIYWLQFLFLVANYPLIYRDLRFIWEMICKASCVYLSHSAEDYQRQLDRMKTLDKRFYGWESIKKALDCIRSFDKPKLENQFASLWNELNSYIHPSYEQVEKIVNADPNILIIDTFNKDLSLSCLKNIDAVLDIVFTIMINCFPKIKKCSRKYRKLPAWEKSIPFSLQAIQLND